MPTAAAAVTNSSRRVRTDAFLAGSPQLLYTLEHAIRTYRRYTRRFRPRLRRQRCLRGLVK
jgi:hypothetical protein